MAHSPSLLGRRNAATFLGLGCVCVGFMLFGADTRAASLSLSISVFIANLVVIRTINTFEFRPEILVMFGVWALLTLTHLLTGRLLNGIHEYLMLMAGGCVFALGQYGGGSKRGRNESLTLLTLFMFLYALYAFLQHMISPDLQLFVEKSYHKERLTGSFLSANTAASVFGLFSIILSFRLLRSLRPGATPTGILLGLLGPIAAKPVSLSAFLLSITNLVLTGSRAGMVATTLGMVVLFAAFIWEGKTQTRLRSYLGHIVRICLVFGVILTAVWAVSGATLQARFERLSDDLGSRQTMLDASWEAGQRHPIWGHGLGGFKAAIGGVSTPETNASLGHQKAAHNLFAQWFVQAGWPGVFGVFGVILVLGWRAMTSRQNPLIKGVRLACLVCIVSHGMVDYALEIPAVFLFSAFVFGIFATEH